MRKSKILDIFYDDLYCRYCKKVTEHHIQKEDEDGNGEFIGYYKECLICEHMEDTDIYD